MLPAVGVVSLFPGPQERCGEIFTVSFWSLCFSGFWFLSGLSDPAARGAAARLVAAAVGCALRIRSGGGWCWCDNMLTAAMCDTAAAAAQVVNNKQHATRLTEPTPEFGVLVK